MLELLDGFVVLVAGVLVELDLEVDLDLGINQIELFAFFDEPEKERLVCVQALLFLQLFNRLNLLLIFGVFLEVVVPYFELFVVQQHIVTPFFNFSAFVLDLELAEH